MYSLELLKATRKKFISLIDDLSAEEINKIPAGFNNNIAWNLGHTIVSAYSLAYVTSGVNSSIQILLADKYKKGTKPELFIGKDEIEILKKSSNDFFVQIEKDLSENKFQFVKPYTTQTFGVETKNIEEYLLTILGHEMLHYATALSIKKIIIAKHKS
jgi:hypothetical protein